MEPGPRPCSGLTGPTFRCPEEYGADQAQQFQSAFVLISSALYAQSFQHHPGRPERLQEEDHTTNVDRTDLAACQHAQKRACKKRNAQNITAEILPPQCPG